MHDARDAEDKRLLEVKEHTQLLENYVYLVREWVSLRVRDRRAGDEVAQRVFLRLWKELADGRTSLLALEAPESHGASTREPVADWISTRSSRGHAGNRSGERGHPLESFRALPLRGE